MPGTDYIPQNDLQFNAFVKQMLVCVTENLARFGLAETTEAGKWYKAELLPRYATYDGAFNDWRDPAERTPLKIALLKRRRSELEPVLRELATMLKGSLPSVVTAEDLISLGLPPRPSGHHVPSPIEDEPPGTAFDVLPHGIVHVRFFDRKTNKKAKPRGQHGVECRWMVSDEPRETVDVEELIHSAFDTHTPLILDLGDKNRGKHLYMAFRWENTRGEKGRFTDIEHTMLF